MDLDNGKPGKTFIILIAGVAGVAVLAGILIPFLMGLSKAEKTSLKEKRVALKKANDRDGPLPTPRAVEDGKTYRKNLERVKEDVETFFRARDGNLEKFFPEFDPKRSGGDYFQSLHRSKADALYEQAKPVLVRDVNGDPAPAAEIFAFEEWEFMPVAEEVRDAQKKFNIREAVTDLLLEMAGKTDAAGKTGGKHIAPRLVKIVFGKPAEVSGSATVIPVPCRVSVLMDPRDVPLFLSGMAGPGKHGLLVRLGSLTVKKTETLRLSYPEIVKPGEEPKLKPEGFLKPVHLTLAFEVLDYRVPKKSE